MIKGNDGMKKRHVCYIAVCLIALLVLVVFLGRAVNRYSNGIYRNIRETTTESVRALTSDRVKMLDKTLNLLEVQAQVLADHMSDSGMAVTPEQLKTLVDMDEDYLHVAVFDVNGTVAGSEPDMPGISKDHEVYQKVFAGEYGVTDPFLGDMGYEEVRVYAPVYQEGEIAGGVFLDMDAEVLRSAGKSPLYDSAGYSYVLKQDGTILLAPATYSYAQIYHNVRDIFLFSESSQETVDAFMEALKEGKSGSAVLDFSGENQIICFEPSTVKEGWYYVSVLPLALVENNGQRVVRLSSQMVTLFLVVILSFMAFLGMVLFFLLRDKWKQEINEGRVYKAISENIDTCIFIMDRQTHYIRYAFENVHCILGISTQEVQGSIFSVEWLKEVGLPEQVADLVKKAESSSQPVTEELLHYNRHLEKEVWISVSVLLLNLKGRKEYMVTFTDVTENRRLMEQLHTSMLEAQSASAAKSSFLANMSHDIRTPMNAITGMTDIAIRNIDNRDRVMDCLRKISISSRNLKGLINDILDMSKIESGKLSLNPGITRLPEVLEGLIHIVQFQASEKGQKLEVMIQNVKHETIVCDAVRLNQALLNILANAVKFTPDGGNIRFLVEELASVKGDEYVRYRFFVKDSGIGMTREFQETMFEAFTREKDSRIEKIEGSGLGMSISKWIVDQMGGTIEVSSEPGRGSEFCVTVDFPVVDEPPCNQTAGGGLLEEGERQQADPDRPLEGCRILLAEDNELNREIASEILSAAGAVVETTNDGFQCLEAFRTSAPGYYRMILMDIRMPVMNGYEAAREIRACGHTDAAAIPILAVTADAFSEDIQAAKDAGMNGHISKPLDMAQLISEVRRHLSLL